MALPPVMPTLQERYLYEDRPARSHSPDIAYLKPPDHSHQGDYAADHSDRKQDQLGVSLAVLVNRNNTHIPLKNATRKVASMTMAVANNKPTVTMSKISVFSIRKSPRPGLPLWL